MIQLHQSLWQENLLNTAQKMKFSIQDSISKCNSKSAEHLLMKPWKENFIFCEVEVNDLLGGVNILPTRVLGLTPRLKSDLCDYSDAYIVIKWRINVAGTKKFNRRNKKLTFKNNAPFWLCPSKTKNTLTNNAVDLYIVRPMYNLLEYTGKWLGITT